MQRLSDYFLGGNTSVGFYSLYDGFCPARSGQFLWIIKGGPGCGKSTFMNTLAAAAEEEGVLVERVWCSGDPQSLDGICIPAWGVGYADGTAPHVLEVAYPAAGGAYLDLGQFYDLDAIRPMLSQLVALTSAYRARYQEAYRLLAGYKADAPQQPWQARAEARFVRAITCDGLRDCTPSTVQTVSAQQLHALAEAAVLLGRRVIDLRSPLHPACSEGYFLPDTGACFRAEDAPAEETLATVCAQVCPILQQARALHDELEALYNPHVDFAGVATLAQAHIARYKK